MFTTKIDEIRSYIKARTDGKCTPHWSWLCIKVMSLLSKYPSGITKAIILADLHNSWLNFSQIQGYSERFSARKVNVDSVVESKYIRQDAILEVKVESIKSIPGTHTKLAVLRNVIDGKYSLDMYLHQKLYQIEHVALKHKLRFTGCRLWKEADAKAFRLLPSEQVVVLLEGEDMASMEHDFLDLEQGLCNVEQPQYGLNIKATLSGIGNEEIVHLQNGETSVKICVSLVDSQDVHVNFCLWDEQLPLANLFKEGDTLLIRQPFIVPNAKEGYTLEYGPATIIFCLPHDANREIIPSQMPVSTPIYVSKDNQGMLDYSSYPEQILISDVRAKMIHVTLFGRVVSVTCKEEFENDHHTGHTFSMCVRDSSGMCDVIIYDHTREYHDAIYSGQCVVMEGLHSVTTDQTLSTKICLETWSSGRLWNASALSGWIATHYLADDPVSLTDANKYTNCFCKAVVTEVVGCRPDSTSHNISYVHRVHSACFSEIEGGTESNLCCKKCDTSHLKEINQKSPVQSTWQWHYCISLVLHDKKGSLVANLTEQTAQKLFNIPAVQFASHLTSYTGQVMESVLAQEYCLGVSHISGMYQIDSLSPII